MSAELPRLTAKQAEVLRFVIQHQKENGYPPTLREIAERFGWYTLRGSTAAAQHIRYLEKKGYVRTVPRRARGIHVLHEP